MRPPSENIFQTRALTVGYRSSKNELRLFENLDLSLNPAELICFMGPNGIGKSTLIRTLAGLHPPLSGETPRWNEKDVAVVLTDRINATQMTVLELITYGRYPYLQWNLSLQPGDRRMIDRSIGEVRIQHLLGKRLYELSDGQMQMTMIARALAQNTPVLLLDEPTAHLDLNNRLEIMNLLRRLARSSGKAILVATHELDLALQTADLIWLATPDRKIKTGIPEDLVLDGSFDEVFQFKGFDLKTGKVKHEAYRNKKIGLSGEGPEYLWTKNALERSGFEVSEDADVVVRMEKGEWMARDKGFNNLKSLLEYLVSDSSFKI